MTEHGRNDSTVQSVKGMNDILPPESARWATVEDHAKRHFARYGYKEIRTPIIEYTPLFVRSIGDTTDVVEKEMYTFVDRDARSITLRPEGTASCVRAYCEHAVHRIEPVTRWYYLGPMFRHERAQKGRYRQFYQIGVESYGVAEPTMDAEQVAMLYTLFQHVGIRNITIALNSVGGPDDRTRYRAQLADFFAPHQEGFCPDCQMRLLRNPLRILDCKREPCIEIANTAPPIVDCLSATWREHLALVQSLLTQLAVPFVVDPRLVRGLDYYTGTTFEVRGGHEGLGAQNALGGGGRYDLLMEELGGPPTPAVGFALGVDRMLLALDKPGEEMVAKPDIYLTCLGEAAQRWGFECAFSLRNHGWYVEQEHRVTSMKAQLKRADKLGAHWVLIVGEAELAEHTVLIRNMHTGTQRSVAADRLVEELKQALEIPNSSRL